MAVFSRAAGALRATARQGSLRFTYITRPTAFASGANQVPRLIHSDVPLSPRLPIWVREEVRLLVKEAVDAEMKTMRECCWDRYQDLSGKLVVQADIATTRYAEMKTLFVETKQEVGTIAFRICLGMTGLAAASHYQSEISCLLKRLVGADGGDPTSQEDISTTVQKAVQAATADLARDIAYLVKVECAKEKKEEEGISKG